ncbi:hypothetical protein S83_058464 [Arachis hypogaea]
MLKKLAQGWLEHSFWGKACMHQIGPAKKNGGEKDHRNLIELCLGENAAQKIKINCGLGGSMLLVFVLDRCCSGDEKGF